MNQRRPDTPAEAWTKEHEGVAVEWREGIWTLERGGRSVVLSDGVETRKVAPDLVRRLYMQQNGGRFDS